MDTPPHRLGLERVVEVCSGHDDLVAVTGSGHVLGPDLVLTSGHVAAAGRPCRVRPPASARWLAAEPVWRGRGGVDVVLLRVSEPVWNGLPGVEHHRWGRVPASRPLRCVAVGFERTLPGLVSPPAGTASGLVGPLAGAVSKALAVSVPEADGLPAALWQGMSGAVLLAEPAGQIVGVAVRPGGRGLDAVPATALLGDARFRELVGAPPGSPETVTEGEPSMVLPALLAPARGRPPQDCSDWALLPARHAVVPFLGRDAELGELREWAAEPVPLSIAVLSGHAGTGRTRLAGELCAELTEAGWDTGFLPLDTMTGLLSGTDAALDAPRPTLVVVERPERSAPVVGELIRRLAGNGRNHRVRLLLLAREPGEAEWWRRLDTAAGGRLRRLNTTTVRLNPHPLTLAERTEHALTAMKAFAPSRAALPSPPRLDSPEYGLPLHVHLAALLRLRDGDGAEETAGDGPSSWFTERKTEAGGTLLGRFVGREHEQWARVWPDGAERVGDLAARQAVAVLTLTAPAPAELPGLLTAVPGLRNRAPHADAPDRSGAHPASPYTAPLHVGALNTAGWLTRVFPLSPDPHGGGRLTPIGPDLVAEQLLAETEDLAALVLAVHDHEARTVHHLVRMLDVLRLSAGREPVRSALWSLVASRLARMVAQAVANPATGLGDALNSALTLFAGDRQLAEAAAALPPGPDARGTGLGLRALNVTLSELAVRHRRGSGGRLALAGALTWSSAGLAAVGRVGEAVVAAAGAVETYAGAPPYEDAAGRAEALFGLGACLLLGGEADAAFKPAQEAAARYRILAEEDPRYTEPAARAHYNLACALLEIGRLGEAVEAFEAAGGSAGFAAPVRGVLAAGSRGTSSNGGSSGPAGARTPPARGVAGTPMLPAPIPQASAGFLGGGDAAELLAPYERPGTRPPITPGAAARPPSAPALSRVPLHSGPGAAARPAALVQEPGGTGRPPIPPVLPGGIGAAPVEGTGVAPLTPFEGTSAAAALPELAAAIAVAATSAVQSVAPTSRNVAQSLHLAAVWLERHGRPADARVPAAEAVVRLRALAAEEPGLRAMLASAAAVLSRLHARLDDVDAAVRSAAESVRNLRALVTLEPDEHRRALADQLLDLGELLLIDDRPDEALAALREAATAPPERRTATRARGRWLLALCLDELGRTADGRAQLDLAIELYDVLSLDDDTFRPLRDEARGRLERTPRDDSPHPAAGEPWLPWPAPQDDAVDRAERRLAECREAVEGAGTPGIEQVHGYLSAQATLARAWADTGRPRDGLALATRAAELLRRHAGPDRPHAIAAGMVAAALGRSLVGLGRHEEAVPHLVEAIESYEPHAGTSAEFRTELAGLMALEAVALSRAGRPSDAESAADRAVGRYEQLVAERVTHPLALAGALHLQAGLRFARPGPGQPRQDAEQARQAAVRALGLIPSPITDQERLLAAACMELAGLCLAELGEDDAARERLTEGTAAMARLGPVPGDLAGVHLRALLRLARSRVADDGPAAGTSLYAQLLGLRPVAGELDGLVESLAWFAAELARQGPHGAPAGVVDGLVGPLTAFTEALEREVPLSGAPETFDGYARCLASLSATAAQAGAGASAVSIAELSVRVRRGLAAASPAYREELGTALAALAALPAAPDRNTPGHPAPARLAVLEQAIDLLSGYQDHPATLQ
ncbi:hypothetical protein ACWEPC_11700, partial [Nonomuraea sp. NPDC004297]